jgi:glycosyltransferase involved in cell wall biosynthesis
LELKAEMKVLIINSNDLRGGASIAARRISNTLKLYYNVNQLFVVGNKKSNVDQIICSRKNRFEKYIELFIHLFTSFWGLQQQWFPFSKKRLLKIVKQFNPELIHIHNTHGIDSFLPTTLMAELSKVSPIIWTLHDMWSFTGNAAHSNDTNWKILKQGKGDNLRYPQIMLNNGTWLLKQKKSIYGKSDITFVCPSMWLTNLSLQSPALNGKRIINIKNGIDLTIFRPLDKIKLREKFNIESNERVLLFLANSLSDKQKGGKELDDILSNINKINPGNIVLVLIGGGKIKSLAKYSNFRIIQLPYQQNEISISEVYNIADVLIYPSKVDNLPFVLIEAIACGLPCISFDIGGCNEIIRDNFNGYLIPPFNSQLFVEKIIYCFDNPYLLKQFSANGRMYAEQNFDIKSCAENYFKLFQDTLSRRQ